MFQKKPWEIRLAKSKILVFGGGFEESDFKRWGFLDSSFMTLGNSWNEPKKDYQIDNPFLVDWNNDQYWEMVRHTLSSKQKTFEAIYVDYSSLWKFLDLRYLKAFAGIVRDFVQKGGFFYWPLDEFKTFQIEERKRIAFQLNLQTKKWVDYKTVQEPEHDVMTVLKTHFTKQEQVHLFEIRGEFESWKKNIAHKKAHA